MIPEPIRNAWTASVTIPDRRPIYEWANSNVILPSMYAQAGRFSVESSRYMIRAFEALTNPTVGVVDLLKAIQTGGTLVSEFAVLWWIANDPGPIMWTFQSDSDAKEHCKSRWNPLMMSVDALKPVMPRQRHAHNTQEIYFGPFFLIVNGANLNSLQSKSIRYKINDEVWLWADGLLAEARGRVSAFEAAKISKILNVSQAGKAGMDWERQWQSGTCENWGFMCDCNNAVELLREHGEGENRSGLVWDFDAKDEDGKWNVARCAETAHYQCPHCGKRWENTDKTRGIWNKRGLYVAHNETQSHVSLRWNSLVNRDMALLVEELTEAENMKLKGAIVPLEECLQKRFAEFTSDETFADVVEVTTSGYSIADYFDGSLKLDGETARFMSVDRQLNHYYALARAYRDDGSSRLIYASRVETKEQLREVQQRLGIGDFNVCLDSSFQTEDCYRICAEYRWIALEGSEGAQEWVHRDNAKRFYSAHQQNKTEHGICYRHLYGGERLKDMLARRREMPEYWQIPDDAGDQYIDSVTSSEVKKEVISKATGRPAWKWKRVKRNNHFWDCEVMNLALAMIRGVVGSTVSRKPVRAETQPDPEPQQQPQSFRQQVKRPVVARQPGRNWATSW